MISCGTKSIFLNFNRVLVAVCMLSAGFSQTAAPRAIHPASPEPPLLDRTYHAGEVLAYDMRGVNEGRSYEAHARGIVKKNPAGEFYEEYQWSNLTREGSPVALPPANNRFRQVVSLEPLYQVSIPDFGQVPPLVGPILDFLTFYVDLQLAERQGLHLKAGDHAYVKSEGANSWADGRYVTLGEDSVDFDLTVKEVNTSDHTATLLVKHVPPENPAIKLPAKWMNEPVTEARNNWVEVHKNEQGTFVAAVGLETFDVVIRIDLADGKILSASMDNPVHTVERECTDEALTICTKAKPHDILRQIELRLRAVNSGRHPGAEISREKRSTRSLRFLPLS